MAEALTRTELESVLITPEYHQFLGLQLEELTEQSITIRLPYKKLFHTSADGYIHGGIISTLIDIAGFFAVFRLLNRPAPTVDLKIDFLRPAKASDLLATASLVKLGRTFSIADVVVRDAQGKEVAIGRGLFSSK